MSSRPFIPAPNTASIEMIYSLSTEVYENVFHVYKSTPFSLADLQALRAVMDSYDNTSGKNLRNTAAFLTRIRTRALDTPASPLEDYYLPTPRGGTLSGTNLPPLNVAFCVKLSTGKQGRSQRGRVYFGGLSATQISDPGHVLQGTANNMVASLATLMSNLAAAGYTLCITSYRANKAWRSTAQNTAVITAVAVDTALDSQRRRLPGRGRAL